MLEGRLRGGRGEQSVSSMSAAGCWPCWKQTRGCPEALLSWTRHDGRMTNGTAEQHRYARRTTTSPQQWSWRWWSWPVMQRFWRGAAQIGLAPSTCWRLADASVPSRSIAHDDERRDGLGGEWKRKMVRCLRHSGTQASRHRGGQSRLLTRLGKPNRHVASLQGERERTTSHRRTDQEHAQPSTATQSHLQPLPLTMHHDLTSHPLLTPLAFTYKHLLHCITWGGDRHCQL